MNRLSKNTGIKATAILLIIHFNVYRVNIRLKNLQHLIRNEV